ncbi:hypothetical protein B296_00050354 [Ensete ventricosum]|uniref:Uncharacterized protein n=1 Tax=Ensete ventricosum TaxID=4639 RepID=A0A426XEF3_ENSVE|nr:hypothetical protein B296_00050354 [Ensete ventricosum]
MKALESTRAELPKQAVVHYKESASFKEGLKRMGRVTYEYGYRVALACFRALHSDSEVEEDPFTIHPEVDLVPMKRQHAFDDSDPPDPFSDNFDDSVRTLPVRSHLPTGSSRVADLGFP